jgi:cell wall assembly regulator SMI1
MTITILKSGASLSSQELTEAENRIGKTIPADYRSFLLKHNGGYPDPSDFSIDSEHSPMGTIEYFLGINVAEHFNLERYLRVFEERIPSYLFPIATDPGGNIICIGIAGEQINKIYFWDHEFESEEGEKPTSDNVYFIADSLAELLNKLT